MLSEVAQYAWAEDAQAPSLLLILLKISRAIDPRPRLDDDEKSTIAINDSLIEQALSNTSSRYLVDFAENNAFRCFAVDTYRIPHPRCLLSLTESLTLMKNRH